MKNTKYILSFGLAYLTATALYSQGNIGINITATRARVEVNGVGNTAALFGGDGTGISFQKNLPTVGFNQYRRVSGAPLGTLIGNGYSAIQYLDPATGILTLAMHPNLGGGNVDIGTPYFKAISIFPNASVAFGDDNPNAPLGVDAVPGNSDAGIYFQGTQYPSYINYAAEKITNISPGKAGGSTIINDIPGGNVVIGSASSQVGINTDPTYLTTWAIRNSAAGNGLVIINESSFNHWEWYASNDNPVWIGIKYNANLIADFSPIDGQHHYVSDRRLKKDIKTLSPVLDRVLQLKPVRYNMKDDKTKQPLTGFIAQDVEKIFPDLVNVLTDHTPGYKGLRDLRMLNYSQFFVLAIKAIQEQQEQIQQLNEELRQLEKL